MEQRWLAIAAVLVMSLNAVLLLAVDNSEGAVPNAPSRAPPNDYLYFEAQSFDSDVYPTFVQDFYLYVSSMYSGEDYDDTDPTPGNYTAISELKYTFAGLYDDEMQLVNPAPIEWTKGTISDNYGKGYTLDTYWSNVNLYADDSSNSISFRVKKDGIAPGDYIIRVRGEFKTMTGWDGVDQFEFKRSYEDEHIHFSVRSCLSPTDEVDRPLVSWSEDLNQRPFYAGSNYRMVGMNYLYSYYGTMTDIRATLTITEPVFHVDDGVAFLPDLNTNTFLYWRVTAAPNAAPGPHVVMTQFTYKFNGIMVNETPVAHTLMVAHTPLLLPPENNGMTTPAAVLEQKDTEGNLVVMFRNAGNVALKNIRLRLDLQSSAYVKFKEFYYYEENSAYKIQSQMIVEAGDLAIGQEKEVTFPAFKLQQYMPPGKYMIPVDYECTYFDGGETGNPSGNVVAGYWDEKGINVHQDILQETWNPKPEDWQLIPFLYVMVEDDEMGPDIQMISHSSYISQTRGSTNRYMYFQIYNYEYYQFDRMTYTIHTDEGSPLLIPGSAENSTTTTFPPIYRPNLPAGSPGNIGSDTIQFYADIKDFAKVGATLVPIDISGFDQYMQPLEKRVYVELYIMGRQPKFKVISTSTSNVTDDGMVTVTATVQNYGEGIGYNITTQYFYSGSGYACTDGRLPLTTELRPGEKATVVFHVRTLAQSYYIRGSHYGYLSFSYYDETLNFYEMGSASDYFYFYIYAVLPNMYITDVRSGLLDWGKTTEVTVKVTNAGGTEAFDVMAYIPQNTNQFTIVDNEIEVGDIAAGQTKEFKFKVKAASEFTDGTTYTFYIYFKYRNVENRTLTYAEGEVEYLYLRTKERIGDNQIQVIQEKGIDDGTGILFMGIFVLIGMVIFTIVYSRVKKAPKEHGPDPSAHNKPKVRAWEE
ncbi:MAG: hypothetical protein MUC62_04550 [Candidatus Thermoplasmatota archaeon]|jgi:hypothetical protein|nr:hypothetical protein [Candidatus Thermoplasmatota archaeon]